MELNAELSVIGSALVDSRIVPALMQQLTPDDFQDSSLRNVFEAVRQLFLEQVPVDPVTVLDRLTPSYEKLLARAMMETPTAAHFEEYARIVRERRQLTEIRTAVRDIVLEDVDLPRARELLAQAAALLVEHQADRDRSYTELISDALDRQNDRTPPDVVDFGIPALTDKLLIGPGRFVILGADSSVGKTALALQFALAAARAGKRVGFFSYETTLPDATDRLLANDADVSLGRAKARKLSTAEILRISDAGERSCGVPLRILETARYTVEDIRAKTLARRFQVIFVDYLQLIPTRRQDRYEAVTEISIGLHALAQELGVTVVALSQVTLPETNKKGDRRYITKEDLRESRQLKQDADVILLLDLADPTDRDSNRVLLIDKNRDGPLGHLVLSFDPGRMRFSFVPPVEDPAAAAARERNEKMDRNREERRRKEAAKEKQTIDGQGSFYEVEDGEEDLPFKN